MTLFDVEPTHAKKPRKISDTPTWTANTTRATCYDCLTQLAAGEFITPMRAQWRRTLAGVIELYCYAHATQRRDADHAEQNRAA